MAQAQPSAPVALLLIGAALTLLPPLLVGSVYPPVILTLGALAAAMATAALVLGARAGSRPRLTAWTVAALVATLACGLQLIPLPEGLLALVAPRTHEARASLAPLVEGVSRSGPVTLSAADTTLAMARWAALALTSLALATWSRLPGRRSAPLVRWVSGGLAVSGVVQALIGAVHLAVDTEGRVLGLVETTLTQLFVGTGTFVNPNHAGALAAMALAASLGMAAGERGSRRWLWGGAAMIVITHGVLLASRGGLLAMGVAAVGVLAHSALLRVDGEGERGLRARAVAAIPWVALLAAPIALALAITSWLSLDDWLAWELGRSADLTALSREGKIVTVRAALAMLPEVWPAGIGADAFGHVSAPVEGRFWAHRHSFVESDPVQLLVDFGVLIGGALIALIAVGFVQLLRRAPLTDRRSLRRERRRLGLVYATVAFAVSGAVSFNLEVLGLALPALACAEVALRARRGGRAPEVRPALGWAFAGGAAALLVAAAVLSPARQADQGAVEALRASDAPVTPRAARSAAARALDLAPDDALTAGQVALLLVGAHREDERGLERARALAAWSARRAPRGPAAHVALARVDHRLGRPEDAADHYARALAVLNAPSTGLLQEIFAAFDSPELRGRAIPERDDTIRAAVQLLYKTRGPDEAFAVAVELQARHQSSPVAHRWAAQTALNTGQPVLAELYARAMVDAFPEQVGGYRLTLRALQAQGRHAEALAVADDALERLPDAHIVRLERVAICLAHPTVARGCRRTSQQDLARLRVDTVGDDALRARYFHLSGLRWKKNGDFDRARRDFQRAVKLAPNNRSAQQELDALGK